MNKFAFEPKNGEFPKKLRTFRIFWAKLGSFEHFMGVLDLKKKYKMASNMGLILDKIAEQGLML